MNAARAKRGRGRPPKFDEQRKAITVTLPERVLRLLESVDSDRAQAIAKVAQAALRSEAGTDARLVELVNVSPTQSVIVVAHSASLHRIPWLKLVEIAPARNLLIIPSGTPVESLEIAILDLIENLQPADQERLLLEELKRRLSELRREQRVSKAEIIFFNSSAGSPAMRRPARKGAS